MTQRMKFSLVFKRQAPLTPSHAGHVSDVWFHVSYPTPYDRGRAGLQAECEGHHVVLSQAAESLGEGTQETNENARHSSPEGGRLPEGYRVPARPELFLALPRGEHWLEQVLPPPWPLPVSVANETFLTLQDLCLCPSPGLECPPAPSEGLCIPQRRSSISHLSEEADRCALA